MVDISCIKECAQWILVNNFLRVGLEFPSDPQHAVQVSKLLKEEIGYCPIVLEDSNRACGNCCVDERTAKPRNIDAIIHFGRTCLTSTEVLPVMFVLNPDILVYHEHISGVLASEEGPKKDEDLILVYDVLCSPSIGVVYSELKKQFSNLILSKLIIPEKSHLLPKDSKLVVDFQNQIIFNDENENLHAFNYRQINLPKNKSISDYNFIYIGPNNSSLIALQMRFSDKVFYNINPADNKLLVSNFIKVVMSRSKKIEQVKDAKTIGLLSTLVQGHHEVLERLKRLIKASNKRPYSFFMGKINEAKLANIVGVDVFVYIGCPESSLFDRIENTYLYKNIVTPWELEVGLNPNVEWSLNFETNFKEFLNAHKYDQNFAEYQNEESTEVDSLQAWKDKNCSTIAERNPGTLFKLHENGAGEALNGLSWQGLNLDQESSVPLGTVVEGRKGIAMEYDSDKRN